MGTLHTLFTTLRRSSQHGLSFCLSFSKAPVPKSFHNVADLQEGYFVVLNRASSNFSRLVRRRNHMQVFWKKEELDMLRFTSLHRETMQRKAVIGSEFASVLPVSVPHLTSDHLELYCQV